MMSASGEGASGSTQALTSAGSCRGLAIGVISSLGRSELTITQSAQTRLSGDLSKCYLSRKMFGVHVSKETSNPSMLGLLGQKLLWS